MKHHVLNAGVFVLLIGLFAFAANDWKAPWAAKAAHGADWCKAHETPLSTCEKCKPELARGGTYAIREREPKEGECPNTIVRVHLAPDVVRQLGIDFTKVEPKSIAESIRANAEVQYPPGRYARVAPRIPGVIREVKTVLGQEVEQGTALAVVESMEFGQAKSDLLQAASLLRLREKTFESEKALFEKKITPAREYLQAETEYEETKLALGKATQRLATLGISEAQVKAIREKQDTSPLLEVLAPFAGIVVEVTAVVGETSGPEKPVFSVASLDRLWLSIDIQESDLPKVEKDQKVSFTVEGLSGKKFPGKIVAIGSEVDDRTRTARGFAEIKNVDGLLRVRMFGRAEITVKVAEPRLILPKTAVQNDGDCYLVFVSPTANAFKARKIQVGTIYEQGYEVTGGLAAGETVVANGSFLLKSEVMRGQMGAG